MECINRSKFALPEWIIWKVVYKSSLSSQLSCIQLQSHFFSVYFGNMVLSDVGLVRNRSTQVGGKSQIKFAFLLCVHFLSFQVIWQTLAHPLLLTLMCRQVCYASQFNVSDSETSLLCFHHRHTYQQRGDPWEQISFLLQLAKKESTLAMLERNITWRQI